MKKIFFVLYGQKQGAGRPSGLETELSGRMDAGDVVPVFMDKNGKTLAALLRRYCRKGFREFFVVKAGPLPVKWEKDGLPMEIEKVRRDFLDMDLHYAAVETPYKMKNHS